MTRDPAGTNSPCVCARVRRAARAMTQLYDAALAPAGLTVAQFSLLQNLRRLAEPHIAALAEATGLDRSTLGRNLRLLEMAGLVRLDPGGDRRMRLVSVTAQGERTVAEAMPLWRRVQADVIGRLGEERRNQLYALLVELERAQQPPTGA
ncbi:MAG: MarR family winged helix-turn-helix transcriptional regulator [Rhodospirillales bacterium]